MFEPHLEVRRPSPTTVEFIVTTQPRRSGLAGWALMAVVVAVRLLLATAAAIVLWAWSTNPPPPVWAEAGSASLLSASLDGSGSSTATTAAATTTTFGANGPAVVGSASWLLSHLRAPPRPLLPPLSLSLSLPLPLPFALTVPWPWSWQPQLPPALARAAAACATIHPLVVLPLCAAAVWASVARVHTSESLLVLRGLGIQTRSTGATYVGDLLAGLARVWRTLTAPWALFGSVLAGSGSSSLADGVAFTGGSGGGVSSAYAYYDYCDPSPAATRFIPTETLQDLLVNEAFRGFEVRYYLVAIVGSGSGCARGGHAGKARRDPMSEEEEEEEEGEEEEEEEGEEEGRGGGGKKHGKQKGGSLNGRDGSSDEGHDRDFVDEDCGYGDGDDDDEAHIVVVFPRLLPGLDVVRTVWREARACLYEPDE
ncbi:hypothetical protein SPI_01796 [Niveomyces insectorum RCEF 264]|uniref:Phosphatidylinositol N-acetylglucosaminyltransferase subunit H conserved domain-containing protein n=1 Tax=Niveomyces insectorum RCEF 264 TaxID=1081102 RepID=A0A167Z8U8_9HYPO|nr:hypothetical protein SPI_01796 [Niveomyces insectorum RCEF 264]